MSNIVSVFYNLCISCYFTGHDWHDIMFFIKRKKGSGNAQRHKILIYDSNVDQNLIRIGRNFLATFKNHEAHMYSKAVHGLVNRDGRCGHYAWLETYLCFDYFDNPFHRKKIYGTPWNCE